MDTFEKQAKEVCDKWKMFDRNSPSLQTLITEALRKAYQSGQKDMRDMSAKVAEQYTCGEKHCQYHHATEISRAIRNLEV